MSISANTETPRTKRKYTKRQAPMREEVRQVETAREPVRESRKRVRKGNTGSTDIPLEILADYGARGIDLQWVTVSVNQQPMPQIRAAYEVNGWQPLLAQDAPEIAALFMPKGWKGEIEVFGLVLMERPMELTQEAKAEERIAAQQQIGVTVSKLSSGQIDGVSLDTQHPSARANTRLTREVMRGIPVTKD